MTFKAFFFSFGNFNRPFDVVKLSFLDPLPCLGGFVVDSGAPFCTDRVIRELLIYISRSVSKLTDINNFPFFHFFSVLPDSVVPLHINPVRRLLMC